MASLHNRRGRKTRVRLYYRVIESTPSGAFSHQGIYATAAGAQQAIDRFPVDQRKNMKVVAFEEGRDYGPGYR